MELTPPKTVGSSVQKVPGRELVNCDRGQSDDSDDPNVHNDLHFQHIFRTISNHIPTDFYIPIISNDPKFQQMIPQPADFQEILALGITKLMESVMPAWMTLFAMRYTIWNPK